VTSITRSSDLRRYLPRWQFLCIAAVCEKEPKMMAWKILAAKEAIHKCMQARTKAGERRQFAEALEGLKALKAQQPRTSIDPAAG